MRYLRSLGRHMPRRRLHELETPSIVLHKATLLRGGAKTLTMSLSLNTPFLSVRYVQARLRNRTGVCNNLIILPESG